MGYNCVQIRITVGRTYKIGIFFNLLFKAIKMEIHGLIHKSKGK